MKFGVITFPGSNCDHDAVWAFQDISGHESVSLWHDSTDLQGCDVIIVPGGFSYGDYLRTGAIARFSPIMAEVKKFAAKGGLVLGICNGFQILCETGLLPGVLMRNESLKFICKPVYLRVETTATPFSQSLKKGETLEIPIAHMEGNYFCDAETLAQLKAQDRIVFRYATAAGEVTPEANPNGSIENIAGICNEGRNVLGMMPHPERAADPLLGMTDGIKMLKAIIESAALTAK
jgi:phosphoribosylformylglycinamidine synthase